MRACSHLVAVAVVVFGAATARADLEKDAETLAAGGDFVSAAKKFREAYAQTHRPEMICNAGIAYYKASDLPRAHRYLRRCLEVGSSLESGFMVNVANVVAAVEAALAAGAYVPVEVSLEPSGATIEIAGGAPFDEPLGKGRVWFPRGTYELVASAPGFVTQKRPLRADGSSVIEQHFALSPVQYRDTTRSRRLLGVGISGVGAALVVTGAVFGLRARSLGDEVRETCAQGCDWNLVADKDASGRRAQTIQFVMYGVGGAALIAGAVLFVKSRPTRVAITPTDGGGMVSWERPW